MEKQIMQTPYCHHKDVKKLLNYKTLKPFQESLHRKCLHLFILKYGFWKSMYPCINITRKKTEMTFLSVVWVRMCRILPPTDISRHLKWMLRDLMLMFVTFVNAGLHNFLFFDFFSKNCTTVCNLILIFNMNYHKFQFI